MFDEKFFYALTLDRIRGLALLDGSMAVVLVYFSNRESPTRRKRTALTMEKYAADCCGEMTVTAFEEATKSAVRKGTLTRVREGNRRRYTPGSFMRGPAPKGEGFLRFTDAMRRWLVECLSRGRKRLKGKAFAVALHIAFREGWSVTSAQKLTLRQLADELNITPEQYRAAKLRLTRCGILSTKFANSINWPDEATQHSKMTPRRLKKLTLRDLQTMFQVTVDGDWSHGVKLWPSKAAARAEKGGKKREKLGFAGRILDERAEAEARIIAYGKEMRGESGERPREDDQI